MRQLSAEQRMRVVRLAASKARTSKEIAALFNVKVQTVYSLTSAARKKTSLFTKKKQAELRRTRQQAAIISVVKRTWMLAKVSGPQRRSRQRSSR